MNYQTIVYCVVALLLGMLLANMLKDVCGCKTVEGQNSESPTSAPLAEGIMCPVTGGCKAKGQRDNICMSGWCSESLNNCNTCDGDWTGESSAPPTSPSPPPPSLTSSSLPRNQPSSSLFMFACMFLCFVLFIRFHNLCYTYVIFALLTTL